MAIIPNTIVGHVSSSCVSTKVFKGRENNGYGTKSAGIITFSFDNTDTNNTISGLKTTYDFKLIPSDANIPLIIEQHYNEDNSAFDDIYVINDEDKIYVLVSDVSTQPLIFLLGQTIRIKAFDKIYSCTITSDEQEFMLLLTTNNFPFTPEE